MKPPMLAKWHGYVQLTIRGAHTERLINQLLAKQIAIWDVAPTANGEVRLFIQLPAALQLRSLLRETGCRMHTEARYGVPFSIKVLRSRSFFVAGLFLFLLGLYMLSSLVWTIDIKGTSRLAEEDVIAAAKAEGIHPLQWTFRLQSMDALSKGIQSRLTDVSWVGVTRQGTKINIHVVESTVPLKAGLSNPRHLVAKSDAVVTQIIAERGRAKVKANMKVSKGTVLISGNIGTEQQWKQTAAEGIVKGLVWHEYEIIAPLISKQKVFTGEMKERGYLQAGKRRLQLSGYGDAGFEQYETIIQTKSLSLLWLSLPLGWVKEKQLEVQYVSEARTEAEAAEAGLEQARADIKAKYGTDAKIRMEKILHQKADNGKVKLKVLFEVEQSITEEQLIISMP